MVRKKPNIAEKGIEEDSKKPPRSGLAGTGKPIRAMGRDEWKKSLWGEREHQKLSREKKRGFPERTPATISQCETGKSRAGFERGSSGVSKRKNQKTFRQNCRRKMEQGRHGGRSTRSWSKGGKKVGFRIKKKTAFFFEIWWTRDAGLDVFLHRIYWCESGRQEKKKTDKDANEEGDRAEFSVSNTDSGAQNTKKRRRRRRPIGNEQTADHRRRLKGTNRRGKDSLKRKKKVAKHRSPKYGNQKRKGLLNIRSSRYDLI